MILLLASAALAGVGSGPPPVGIDAGPQRVALVVGLNRYQADESLHDLKYAVDDAEAVGAVLAGDGYVVHDLLDQANPEDFWREFRNATATLQRGDLFLLYFAGHAQLEPGVRENELHLLFSDGADIGIDDLAAAVTELPSEQRVVFLDTCYSERTQQLLSSLRGPPPIESPDVGRFDAWIYSAAPRQAAQEDSKLKHGVFTWYLLQALAGEADVDGDGAVEVLEAYNWVGYRTAEHTGRAQIPRIEETRIGWNDLPLTHPGEGASDAKYAIIPWYKQILPTAQMFIDGATRGPGSLEPGSHLVEVREGDELVLKRKISVQSGDVLQWERMIEDTSASLLLGVGGGFSTDSRVASASGQVVGWWQPRSPVSHRWAFGGSVSGGAAPLLSVRSTARAAFLWQPVSGLAVGPMLGVGAVSRLDPEEGWMGSPLAAPGLHLESRRDSVFFAVDGEALVFFPFTDQASVGPSVQGSVGVVF